MITFAFNEEYQGRFAEAEFALIKVDQDASSGRVKFTFSSEGGEYVVLALHCPVPQEWPGDEPVPPLAGATLASASVYSVYSFGKSKTKNAVFTCRSISMLVPDDGGGARGLVLYGKRGSWRAPSGGFSYSLFGPDGGKAIVAPRESSRAGADALDLEDGGVFDVQSMSARPWVPVSFGECPDGLHRTVLVQLDPDVDENAPCPRIVLRVGELDGSGAAKEALAALAPSIGGDGAPGTVGLVEADAFLAVAAAAHEAGRLKISAESAKSAYVGVIDMYM